MPMPTTVPSSLRRPGAFHEFVHTQAGRGLVPLTARVLHIGIKSAAGTMANGVAIQIYDDADADSKAGQGSQLALMLKASFRQARRQGASPEIWAISIAAPAGNAAAETLTVTGPATASGDGKVRIAGRTITFPVTSGDSANTVAAALKTAIDGQLKDLPITAGVVGAVVTATALHAGVHGNDIAYEVVEVPAGIGVALAQSVAGTGAVDITATVDATLDKDYDFLVVGNHTSTDVSDLVAHNTTAWDFNNKKFRHGVIGERGTLGTANTLATGGNDKTVVVVSAEGCPNLPGEIAAAFATAVAGRERPNANMDGVELDLYPPSSDVAYTAAEVESALASGATPLTPTYENDALKIERAVTTSTTIAGAPFEPLRDIQYSRTAAYIARQVDIAYRTRFVEEVLDGDDTDGGVLPRIEDMTIEIHRAAAALRPPILRDVDEFIDQIIATEASSPAGRVLLEDPFRVAGPLHQLVVRHTHYL